MHRGSRKGVAQRGNKVSFGSFGLQSLERAWITGTQIEAARVAISRGMKRKGSMWIRVFPQKSVTKNRWKCGWARARPTWITGWPWFGRPQCCLKWKACRKAWHARR